MLFRSDAGSPTELVAALKPGDVFRFRYRRSSAGGKDDTYVRDYLLDRRVLEVKRGTSRAEVVYELSGEHFSDPNHAGTKKVAERFDTEMTTGGKFEGDAIRWDKEALSRTAELYHWSVGPRSGDAVVFKTPDGKWQVAVDHEIGRVFELFEDSAGSIRMELVGLSTPADGSKALPVKPACSAINAWRVGASPSFNADFNPGTAGRTASFSFATDLGAIGANRVTIEMRWPGTPPVVRVIRRDGHTVNRARVFRVAAGQLWLAALWLPQASVGGKARQVIVTLTLLTADADGPSATSYAVQLQDAGGQPPELNASQRERHCAVAVAYSPERGRTIASVLKLDAAGAAPTRIDGRWRPSPPIARIDP